MSESEPSPELPELSQELSRMAAADQAARQKLADDNGPEEAFGELDRFNVTRMKVIVAELGWPTIPMVGKDGAFDAWLLVQQADTEPEFQAQCLELMRACEAEEVPVRLMGFLDDRVRVADGRPQLYGTQFLEGEDGKPEPCPIEDPDKLDERRAAIGLGPFEEYRRQVEGD
jgi:hypothetical protein